MAAASSVSIESSSKIGYGMSGSPMVSREARFKMLEVAYDNGCRIFDTAAMYGNEDVLGEFAKVHPDVQLYTKVGLEFVEGEGIRVNNNADFIQKEIEASLARLGRPIDVLFLHRLDAERYPEALSVIQKYVTEGKVRAIGICTNDPKVVEEACKVADIKYVQAGYSLMQRDAEVNGMFTACAEKGIKFVAYFPLGRGLLSTKTAEEIHNGNPLIEITPCFSEGDNLKKNLETRDTILPAIATELGCTSTQLALAWILAKSKALGVDVIPIPGSDNEAHIAENTAATKIALSEDIVARLDVCFKPGVIHGITELDIKEENKRLGAYFAGLNPGAKAATPVREVLEASGGAGASAGAVCTSGK